jgi:hypothetical protein
LYPNPNKGLFSVEINKHGNYFFKLSSIKGKLLYETSMEGYEKEVVNLKLTKGVYVVSLTDILGNTINQLMLIE